jgi:hypothetical protein
MLGCNARLLGEPACVRLKRENFLPHPCVHPAGNFISSPRSTLTSTASPPRLHLASSFSGVYVKQTVELVNWDAATLGAAAIAGQARLATAARPKEQSWKRDGIEAVAGGECQGAEGGRNRLCLSAPGGAVMHGRYNMRLTKTACRSVLT